VRILIQTDRKPAAGFTLIELMLAVGILGLILAMLAGSFNVVSHGKIQAENRVVANESGSAIMWQMAQEIRGIVSTVAVPNLPNAQQFTQPNTMLLVGGGHMQNGIPLDSLSISTFGGGHHRSLYGFGAEDVISYSAQPNPDHRGWFLLLRNQQSALLGRQAGPQLQSVVLADSLLALHIRYFNGQIWNESWDSRAQPEQRPLPVAVSIDLQMASPGGNPMNFSTQVALPMVAFQQR
jgi:prepilin-type N-terminal cleavage/methylation domain-containing protein